MPDKLKYFEFLHLYRKHDVLWIFEYKKKTVDYKFFVSRLQKTIFLQ